MAEKSADADYHDQADQTSKTQSPSNSKPVPAAKEGKIADKQDADTVKAPQTPNSASKTQPTAQGEASLSVAEGMRNILKPLTPMDHARAVAEVEKIMERIENMGGAADDDGDDDDDDDQVYTDESD